MKHLIPLLMLSLPVYGQTNIELGTALSKLSEQFIAERNRTDWLMSHFGSDVIQSTTEGVEIVWKSYNDQYRERLNNPTMKIIESHGWDAMDIVAEMPSDQIRKLIFDSLADHNYGQVILCVRELAKREKQDVSMSYAEWQALQQNTSCVDTQWIQGVASSLVSIPTDLPINVRGIADDPAIELIVPDGMEVRIGHH